MITLQVCSACQSVHYPQRDICPDCWEDALIDTEVSAKGRLVSFTDLHISVKQEWTDKLPLIIGLVKLDVGPNIIAFVNAALPMNSPVTLVQDGDIFTAKPER